MEKFFNVVDYEKIIEELPCGYLCLMARKDFFEEKYIYEVININKVFEELSGYHREIFFEDKDLGFNHIEYESDIISQIVSQLNTEGKNEFEIYSSHTDKYYLVKISRGQDKLISAIFNEISENTSNKQAEDCVEKRREAKKDKNYFGIYDKLTGLYNREHFEEQLKKFEKEKPYPLAIIFGDVNGLKTANDVFGHIEGDRLLKRIAKIILSNCREKDVVCRWGGDEFLILLPDTSSNEAEEICLRIARACGESTSVKVKPSIALGFSIKETEGKSMYKVIREAEKNMYKSKLLDKSSTKSYLMHTLENTLFDKGYASREHSERLKDLCENLGKILKLSITEIEELKLLATFHDIGKIGVPDYIMYKPNKLSQEEWNTLKKHPEIGYKISKSTNDISHISKYILFHHERWDGKGYPQGLKGNSIPKLSRIIAIVDAYDVMTHETPYKDSVSKEAAIDELEKCAESQFDPTLVKSFIALIRDEYINKNNDISTFYKFPE